MKPCRSKRAYSTNWPELNTVKPVFKTTRGIGTTWELRTATPVPRSTYYIEIDLRNKTTPEFRTGFDSPLGVPNSQIPLYILAVAIFNRLQWQATIAVLYSAAASKHLPRLLFIRANCQRHYSSFTHLGIATNPPCQSCSHQCCHSGYWHQEWCSCYICHHANTKHVQA